MEMSNEELLSYLQQMIDAAEKRMAEMCGMQLYKKQEWRIRTKLTPLFRT